MDYIFRLSYIPVSLKISIMDRDPDRWSWDCKYCTRIQILSYEFMVQKNTEWSRCVLYFTRKYYTEPLPLL